MTINIEELKKQVKENKKNKSVVRAVTLPYWLNEAAKKSGINVSGILQEALKKTLNMEEPKKELTTQK